MEVFLHDKDLKNEYAKGINKSILNTLALCNDNEKTAILFDIMLATDNVDSLIIPDEKRLEILCDYYMVKFEKEVKKKWLLEMLNNIHKLRESKDLDIELEKKREEFFDMLDLI